MFFNRERVVAGARESQMQFWDHVRDLRKCLLRSLVGVLATTILAYVFWRQIWEWLLYPLKRTGAPVQLINISPLEAFLTSIKVSLIAGIFAASPWVLWNLWKFIAPGLFAHEKKLVLPVLLSSTLLFAAGAGFCFTVVLPYGLEFLAKYSVHGVEANWRQGEYAGFMLKVLLAFGASFELPVIAFVLARMGLLTAGALVRHFRYAVLVIFVLAALLTPPDPVTQTLLAAPLLAIYGISILVAKLAAGEKEKE